VCNLTLASQGAPLIRKGGTFHPQRNGGISKHNRRMPHVAHTLRCIRTHTVVDADHTARLWLRAALASYGVDEAAIRSLCTVLDEGMAVLRAGPDDVILWVQTDEESEAWRSVEPSGVASIGPDEKAANVDTCRRPRSPCRNRVIGTLGYRQFGRWAYRWAQSRSTKPVLATRAWPPLVDHRACCAPWD
jgi:hypothetical protein